MKYLKKSLGILWMLAGPLLLFLLITGAAKNIDSSGTKDINKAIPWVIIISIFTPVATGLVIFGYYSFKGEYNEEFKNNERYEEGI